jgi:hypothetical protein
VTGACWSANRYSNTQILQEVFKPQAGSLRNGFKLPSFEMQIHEYSLTVELSSLSCSNQ